MSRNIVLIGGTTGIGKALKESLEKPMYIFTSLPEARRHGLKAAATSQSLMLMRQTILRIGPFCRKRYTEWCIWVAALI